jgi:hypothetical protein
MKLMFWGKDGGNESSVWGFWPIEWKRAFSVVLLKFVGESREAFHTHAFNSISWVLSGRLEEHDLDGGIKVHTPSFYPVITRRDTFHQVHSVGTTWVLSFRGPWADTWREYLPNEKRYATLTHGRIEVV